MSNKRAQILELYKTGKRQVDIVQLLIVRQQTVSKRFKELDHEGDRPGSERKRTDNANRNRQIIRKRVNPNPTISMRKIARETGISGTFMQVISKLELRLRH